MQKAITGESGVRGQGDNYTYDLDTGDCKGIKRLGKKAETEEPPQNTETEEPPKKGKNNKKKKKSDDDDD